MLCLFEAGGGDEEGSADVICQLCAWSLYTVDRKAIEVYLHTRSACTSLTSDLRSLRSASPVPNTTRGHTGLRANLDCQEVMQTSLRVVSGAGEAGPQPDCQRLLHVSLTGSLAQTRSCESCVCATCLAAVRLRRVEKADHCGSFGVDKHDPRKEALPTTKSASSCTRTTRIPCFGRTF